MLVYAGIDEAGYGPMFGPLVIARSVFVLPDHDPPADQTLPSLWQLLQGAVCRRISDRRKRIAVNDSKALYTPAQGLTHLERGVLAFASCSGAACGTLDELLQSLAYDQASRSPDQLWYLHASNGGVLPSTVDAGRLGIARAQLTRAMAKANMRCAEINAAVVYEDRFNDMVRATRSKARCSWTFVAGHLMHLWQAYGTDHPRVVIDRQGGRTQYGNLLMQLWPDATLRIVEEGPLRSIYRIADETEGRAITVIVQTDSETQHLPTALASMSAKYLRELLMMRFNAYWRGYRPDLKPTAGYVQDGRRFLGEIEPIMVEMGIDRESLVRVC